MDAHPEALHVRSRDVHALQKVQDRVGPPAEIRLALKARVAGGGVGRRHVPHHVRCRTRQVHIARHVAGDVRRGERPALRVPQVGGPQAHALQVLAARRHQHLQALVLVARQPQAEPRIGDRLRGEMSSRADLVHRRRRAQHHVRRTEAPAVGRTAESQVVAHVLDPRAKRRVGRRQRALRLKHHPQDVAHHAGTLRNRRGLAFLEQREAVDHQIHRLRVAREEMHARDVRGAGLSRPVVQLDDPLHVAARRKPQAPVKAILNAPLRSGDEDTEVVARRLAERDDVNRQSVVAPPVPDRRMKVERRPFWHALAPRIAPEPQPMRSGRGERVRHAHEIGLAKDLRCLPVLEVENRHRPLHGLRRRQQQRSCGQTDLDHDASLSLHGFRHTARQEPCDTPSHDLPHLIDIMPPLRMQSVYIVSQ